jgi:hypothetical protein
VEVHVKVHVHEQARASLRLALRLQCVRKGGANFFQLPHERLHAYQEARKLLECIREAEISDVRLGIRRFALAPACA